MARFKCVWDGKYEHWTEIRAHIKLALFRPDSGDFGFGMDWATFNHMLPTTYYSDRDRKRVEKFRKKIWNKCCEIRGWVTCKE